MKKDLINALENLAEFLDLPQKERQALELQALEACGKSHFDILLDAVSIELKKARGK